MVVSHARAVSRIHLFLRHIELFHICLSYFNIKYYYLNHLCLLKHWLPVKNVENSSCNLLLANVLFFFRHLLSNFPLATLCSSVPLWLHATMKPVCANIMRIIILRPPNRVANVSSRLSAFDSQEIFKCPFIFKEAANENKIT